VYKRQLLSHTWPGNVRELENVIERAFNVLDGNMIQPAHLPGEILKLASPKGENDSGPVGFVVSALSGGQGIDEIIARAEKTVIVQALLICRGNKAKASKMLGISRPGLYKKIVKLGIESLEQ
jgi:DNA-binding NtrC family response regulator